MLEGGALLSKTKGSIYYGTVFLEMFVGAQS